VPVIDLKGMRRRIKGAEKMWLNILIELGQRSDRERINELQVFSRGKHMDQSKANFADMKPGDIEQFLDGVSVVIKELKKVFYDKEALSSMCFHGINLPGPTKFYFNENSLKFAIKPDNAKHRSYSDYGIFEMTNILFGRDIQRLKICDNCGTMFFAHNKKRESCSDKCTRKQNHKKTFAKKDDLYNNLKANKSYHTKQMISLRIRERKNKELSKAEKRRLYSKLLENWTSEKWVNKGVNEAYIKRCLPDLKTVVDSDGTS
jgi:hypothetical protein